MQEAAQTQDLQKHCALWCACKEDKTPLHPQDQRQNRQDRQTKAYGRHNNAIICPRGILVVVCLQNDIQQQGQVCHSRLLPCTQRYCSQGRAGFLHLPIFCISAPGIGALIAPGAPVTRPAAAPVPLCHRALPPLSCSHPIPLNIPVSMPSEI